MVVKFVVDLGEIESAHRHSPILSGADVIEPCESIMDTIVNVFRRTSSGVLLNAHHFKVSRAFVCRLVRRDYLTLQFVGGGGYWAMVEGQRNRAHFGTIRIIGAAQSDSVFVPFSRDIVGVCLGVAREQLIEVFGLKVDNVPVTYRSLFKSQPGVAPVMELPMPPSAWVAVQEIVHCKFPEPLKSEYLSARAAELICHAVAEINTLRRCDPFVGVAAATRERLRIGFAEAIYRREIANPPSLDDVARRVCLNRNKLVAGFRERFDKTPSEYSRQLRLGRAHEMLLSGALAVEAIAAACGYTSGATFTRAFKDKFGYAPLEIAKRIGEFSAMPAKDQD